MKIAFLIAQYLLGLAFTVFGLNGFLHFLPQPPLPAGPAAEFTNALTSTGYIHAIFAVQLLCGLLFLANQFVPLAVLSIAPVIVNILLFHLTMAPHGIAPGIIVAVLWIVVAFRYRATFAPLFRPRART